MHLPNEDVVRNLSTTITTMTKDESVFDKVITFYVYEVSVFPNHVVVRVLIFPYRSCSYSVYSVGISRVKYVKDRNSPPIPASVQKFAFFALVCLWIVAFCDPTPANFIIKTPRLANTLLVSWLALAILQLKTDLRRLSQGDFNTTVTPVTRTFIGTSKYRQKLQKTFFKM